MEIATPLMSRARPSPPVPAVGYVLKDTDNDTALTRIVAVCHDGQNAHYDVDLRPSRVQPTVAPTYLAAAPAALAAVVVSSIKTDNTAHSRQAG